MRPCANPTLTVRGAEFGGAKPLICVPLVARDAADLVQQAHVARPLAPDVIEWRADAFDDLSAGSIRGAASQLRAVFDTQPVIFTLRAHEEGGARPLSPATRQQVIEHAIGTSEVDLVDVELFNGAGFIQPVVASARRAGVRVILSFHDFTATPTVEALIEKVTAMAEHGADVAKFACMPQQPSDVLRVLEATAHARQAYPALPLVTMSMGRLGLTSRVAGFLFGSDMSFAVATKASAPGQIPIGELRSLVDGLLRYA
jgi:3-dehydroquinate dehydratase-1